MEQILEQHYFAIESNQPDQAPGPKHERRSIKEIGDHCAQIIQDFSKAHSQSLIRDYKVPHWQFESKFQKMQPESSVKTLEKHLREKQGTQYPDPYENLNLSKKQSNRDTIKKFDRLWIQSGKIPYEADQVRVCKCCAAWGIIAEPFKNKKDLIRHWGCKHRDWRCQRCWKRWPSQKKATQCCQGVDSPFSSSCQKCGFFFLKYARSFKHINQLTGKNCGFVCGEDGCKKNFRDAWGLSKHKEEQHTHYNKNKINWLHITGSHHPNDLYPWDLGQIKRSLCLPNILDEAQKVCKGANFKDEGIFVMKYGMQVVALLQYCKQVTPQDHYAVIKAIRSHKAYCFDIPTMLEQFSKEIMRSRSTAIYALIPEFALSYAMANGFHKDLASIVDGRVQRDRIPLEGKIVVKRTLLNCFGQDFIPVCRYSPLLQPTAKGNLVRQLLQNLRDAGFGEFLEAELQRAKAEIKPKHKVAQPSDQWGTPNEIIDLVCKSFEIDPTWLFDQTPLKHDFDARFDADGLHRVWQQAFNWTNPPFSHVAAWKVKAAWEFFENGRSIAMLYPHYGTTDSWADKFLTGLGCKIDLGSVVYQGATRGLRCSTILLILQHPDHLDYKGYKKVEYKLSGIEKRMISQPDFSKKNKRRDLKKQMALQMSQQGFTEEEISKHLKVRKIWLHLILKRENLACRRGKQSPQDWLK